MEHDEKKYDRLIAELKDRGVKDRFKESVWRQIEADSAPADDGNRAIKILYAGLAVSAAVAVIIGVLAIKNFGTSREEKILQGRPTTLSAGAQILSGKGGQVLA
jgi:hypothetical protein